MKCTNCGKNNAVSHYRYEVNGKITEAHLCADCARELQPEREFAARSRELFGDMFSHGFLASPLMGGRQSQGLMESVFGRDPFEDFFGGGFFDSPFALLGTPRIEISFPEAERAPAKPGDGETLQVDPELSRQREMNAIREQMRAAAESEDYEKAARLRDKLRELEKDGK